ncbi:MAG: efflux RND transporter periplasmic adaptor subunit [Hyphomicrobiales bacterium]|nr:efflux RND transporter periplasmic adaptor subunit [Hyphomicrobiales bacterium]
MLGSRFIAAALASLAAAPHVAAGRDIAVTTQQVDRLQIKLEEVKAAESEAVALLPATVVPPQNARIAVSAPFAGTVAHVDVLIGQHVEQDGILVTIASRDFIDAVSRLEQSVVEHQAAEVIAKRLSTLAAENAVPLKQKEEATAQLEKLRVAMEQNRRTVGLGNIRANADGSSSLRAPKPGRVVEIRAVAGASLESMAAAVVIDTGKHLWLQAQLPAALIGRIQIGDTVALANGIVGKVISVGTALDQVTRSTMLLVQLPTDAPLVAGQMVTLTVTRASAQGSVNVPARALAWIDGEPAVFVRSDSGFTLTPVKVRGVTPTEVTVEGDLAPGQLVAATGLVQLEKMIGGK